MVGRLRLRLGLLEFGFLRKELVAKYKSYFDFYYELLKAHELPDVEIELVPYKVHNKEYPASVSDCDAFVCSGSKFSVYEEFMVDIMKWFSNFVSECKKTKTKIVGICFGHQALAYVLGGKVERVGWEIGCREIVFDKLESGDHVHWLKSTSNKEESSFSVFASLVHQDHVTQPPENAVLLATSSQCKNQVMVIDNLFLGFQFHPEFKPEFLHDLLDIGVETGSYRFSKESETYTVASSSIHTNKERVDMKMFSEWILRFIIGKEKTK